ncbi:MAG: succinylglutamate desuccinylase/aspartoacylase family protein [Patescibacteria group bacterium]
MKIIRSKNPPLVTIVCCLHGDEVFGLDVFSFFDSHRDRYPRVKLILANETAIKNGARYVDQDLNRSFPGTPGGNLEQRLARELLAEAAESRFVLDIHTTTSDIVMTPIVTAMNSDILKVLNLCASGEIAFVHPAIGSRALIAHVPGGVSLEFGVHYSKSAEALRRVVKIVEALLADRTAPRQRRDVFHVTTVIPKTVALPAGTGNFGFMPELGLFPFLLNEKSYPDLHALGASRKETVVL